MRLTYQKKGSVGYTAVGSPSIVDGVISDSTNSDYIALNNSYNGNSDYEFQIKFKFDSVSFTGARALFISSNGYSSGAVDITRTVFKFFYGAGASTDKRLDCTYSFSANVDYWIKLVKTGNTIKAYVSTDEFAFTQVGEKDTTGQSIASAIIPYIARQESGKTFPGSIDLKQTYIKVNGQVLFGTQVLVPSRVCLQGPVGYTVVGSPVIADGVVSGLDRDNYLRTNNEVTNLISGNFEMQVQYHTNINAASGRLLSTGDALCNGIALENGVFRFKARLADDTNYSWSTNYQVQGDTDYRVNAQRIGNILTLRVYEGNTLVDTVNVDLTDVAFMNKKTSYRVGSYNFGGTIYGTIDLNNTYIKVNGKLWFGKQQANTVTCNHTTVWSHV